MRSGKQRMELRSISQQRFPGRLQRSEAEWKAIRDPAQEAAAKRRQTHFAEVPTGAGASDIATAPVIHIQRFRGSAANNALDSASARAQILQVQREGGLRK
jgi:hypothetical protein